MTNTLDDSLAKYILNLVELYNVHRKQVKLKKT